MRVRDRLRLSKRRQRQLVRLLQFGMVAVLLLGIWYGNGGVVVNSSVGLLVTFLPSVFDRNYQFTMDVGLVLWISTAMFLHAFGTLPLPGLGFLSPYSALWWWDHMTHALSSSLVAGVAYTATRAIEEHTEFITLPPAFLFVYLLMFVMAFGVLWELLEFYIGVVSTLLGVTEVLTQYGLDDSVLDLMYNTLGGFLVAVFGTVHLTDVAEQLSARLKPS